MTKLGMGASCAAVTPPAAEAAASLGRPVIAPGRSFFICGAMAKLTEEFSTHVDDELGMLFRRRAADAGCSAAELLRDLMSDLVWGVTYGEHEAESRRRAIRRPEPAVRQEGASGAGSCAVRCGSAPT